MYQTLRAEFHGLRMALLSSPRCGCLLVEHRDLVTGAVAFTNCFLQAFQPSPEVTHDAGAASGNVLDPIIIVDKK